jgi:hypothetical protein
MAMEQPMRPARIGLAAAAFAAALIAGSPAGASDPGKIHPPMFECASSGALRVTCRGSFADGTSASGIIVRVHDKMNHVIYAGIVDRLGRVSFRIPDAQFSVVFDAGGGNVLTLLGSEMT